MDHKKSQPSANIPSKSDPTHPSRQYSPSKIIVDSVVELEQAEEGSVDTDVLNYHEPELGTCVVDH